MNILYLEHYAGSPEMGMEFRPYYLAREWVKMGHKVIIIDFVLPAVFIFFINQLYVMDFV